MTLRLRHRAIALALSASLVSGFAPSVAFADAPTEAAKSEARDRFDRGLKLFNDGDNAGALAEFKRAYELIANPLVLYNIGLVYAAMSRPVDAVAALDKVLASPGPVTGERLERAKQVRGEQAQRIAEIAVATNVPATVEVDNVAAGQTPLAAPLKVASGTHVVGAMASGYAPLRKEVTVAGGQKAEVKLDLVAMEGKVAHLSLKTHLPGAQLVIDDQPIAKTPLPQSLTLTPGTHKIELRREGYATARQDLTLGDGASAEIALEPEEDKGALASVGGSLALDISEPQAVVRIDGKDRGVYGGAYRLAKGPHRVAIERGGFEPFERDVDVEAGRTTTVRIGLDPTPETRATYVSKAKSQRTWGWILAGAGVLVGGGGAGWLVVNGKKKSDKQATYDEAVDQQSHGRASGPCTWNKAPVNPGDSITFATPEACNAQADDAKSALDTAKKQDLFGWVGIGVGAASLVTGVVLLVTSDDPHKYDRKASDELAAEPRLVPMGWALPGGGGMGLAGTF